MTVLISPIKNITDQTTKYTTCPFFSVIRNQGRKMNIIIMPYFGNILQYGPMKTKELGVRGGVRGDGGVDCGIDRNKSLAIGTDNYSVYDNKMEDAGGGDCQ